MPVNLKKLSVGTVIWLETENLSSIIRLFRFTQAANICVFFLQATELINNELPGDTTTSQVTIVVTDIDDQIPVFNEDNFHISVSEDIGK
jgi:hypothetical protein